MLKKGLKRGAQAVLATAAPLAWRFTSKPALLVLMYHRVLPDDDKRLLTEQPGMWVRPETFRMHVRTIKRHFPIIRLSEWVSRARNNDVLPNRACAITFDDGWRDNYEYALPILVEEQVPATLFLVADMVGTGKRFWPERLAAALRFACQSGQRSEKVRRSWLNELCPALKDSQAAMTTELIDGAINRAKRLYSDGAISQRLDQLLMDVGITGLDERPALVDWKQVKEMVASGYFDIGSHTRRHIRMSTIISRRFMQDEIVESKRMLEEKTDSKVDLFCYPNGDITSDAYNLVKATYLGACSTRKGWHSPSGDPFAIRRIGVHEDIAYDRTSFLSRASAWL